MQKYERIALATRVYNVNCELGVVATSLADSMLRPSTLKDGVLSMLWAISEELDEIEKKLSPNPPDVIEFPMPDKLVEPDLKKLDTPKKVRHA